MNIPKDVLKAIDAATLGKSPDEERAILGAIADNIASRLECLDEEAEDNE